jgi:thiol-disulfide isomerase/thioredoxin
MRLFYNLLIVLVIAACQSKPELPKAGTWRAVIEMQGQQLPFNLIIAPDSAGGVDAFVKNAGENLLLDEVNLVGDSVEMALHIFDAKIKTKVSGDSLKGFFIINYTAGYRLPFKAAFGQDFRFAKTDKFLAVADFSGKYAVQFFNEKDTSAAVAIFTQQGNYAEGTFLTPTGDYRYLEGNIVDDALHLSTFDGNHLYLFKIRKVNDSTLLGEQWLGRGRHRFWAAKKNPKASLPDAETITYLKKGFDKIEFSFPDVDGKQVSLTDEKYKNKVVIVQVLGSWCPNCMDETKFLVPWYEKNKNRGVEILGLAYERKPDFAYGGERVKKMKSKMNVGYDVLIAGVSDNAKALETLPQLNSFPGWPMTIFIGKDGKVKHIHTGFSGPGTGVYYEEQIQRFNSIVNELLKEETTLTK